MASAKQLSSQPFKDCDGIVVAGLFKRDEPRLQPCTSLILCNKSKSRRSKRGVKDYSCGVLNEKCFLGTKRSIYRNIIDTFKQFGTTSSSYLGKTLTLSASQEGFCSCLAGRLTQSTAHTVLCDVGVWTSAQNSFHSHLSRTASHPLFTMQFDTRSTGRHADHSVRCNV